MTKRTDGWIVVAQHVGNRNLIGSALEMCVYVCVSDFTGEILVVL